VSIRPILSGVRSAPSVIAAGAAVGALILPLSAVPARADVVGQIRFVVTLQGAPVAGATITLTDPTNVHADIVLTTDSKGRATSPFLENHTWRVSTEDQDPKTKEYLTQPDARNIAVAADTVVDVEIKLLPVVKSSSTVRVKQNLVKTGNTASDTVRSQTQLQDVPANAGDPQQLSLIMRTVPGFAQDSANQAHPRGEHASTSFYLNGFEIPAALQGRLGAFLAPEAIQSLDVMTGSYAPEYGGETAAVLNLTLRAGTIDPFVDAKVGGGTFNTFSGSVSAGGQFGAPTGGVDTHGDVAKRFSYLFDATEYNTDNSVESPQPDDQTTHNHGQSATVFTNIQESLGQNDSLGLILNFAPANTQIANRAGLPSQFANVGQGYGYGGFQSAGATTTAADGSTVPLLSQQAEGQDIYQLDNNGFGTLQWRKQFSDNSTGVFSAGYNENRINIENHNPAAFTNPVVSSNSLPEDNSIEFSPTVLRDIKTSEFGAGITDVLSEQHIFKYGGLAQLFHGNESYQFIPGSQIALDNLAAIDPALAPAGSFSTTGATDADGNPVYTVSTPSATPTVSLTKQGYYAAGYAQDTWKPSRRFTMNYGLRLDSYHETQSLAGSQPVNHTELSPRINTATVIAPLTILRLSYNHLMTIPAQTTGSVIGEGVIPQISDMYEADLEKQIGQDQTVKVAHYQKYSRHELDTGILIPFTQIGAYETDQFSTSYSGGTEFSYNYQPRSNVGPSGFLNYVNSIAKPHGDQNGDPAIPAPDYNDHDQLNTIGVGGDYTLHNGAFGGLSYYFGSGVESSRVLDPLQPTPVPIPPRVEHQEVDVRFSTGPHLWKSGVGADLDVANLFDSRQVLNFNSGFSGTRFQQGRRIILSVMDHW
jgi:hypothetical protein